MNIKNIIKDFRHRPKKVSVVHVDDIYDDITDEIERSLWILKDELDLPTEEVKTAVLSRKLSKHNK